MKSIKEAISERTEFMPLDCECCCEEVIPVSDVLDILKQRHIVVDNTVQIVFEQLSKEMAVFAQNNHTDYKKLQEFFLYELNLRCIEKRSFGQLMTELTREVER